MFLFVVIELDFLGFFFVFMRVRRRERLHNNNDDDNDNNNNNNNTCAALSDFSHMTGTLLLVGLSCRGILCEDL